MGTSVLSPCSLWAASSGSLINDVTQLNPIWVRQLFVPRTTDDIRRVLTTWPGPVSIGGGRFSMGGQIATEDSLHFDMRQLNQVIHYSPENKVIRVQAGIRWRDLQSVIDPHDLSVKVMQSYANFTVGGALSVNAHGRYVGAGPVSNSVRALRLLLADGSEVEASRNVNTDLFYAAMGSYGALGIITEVELDLVPNVSMERQVHHMSVTDYPKFFSEQIRGNEQAILHNVDLTPPYFDQATSITWRMTDKELTVSDRLVAPERSYKFDQAIMWGVSRLPGGPSIRKDIVDRLRYFSQPVVRRNYEASRDVASLGPIATRNSTYALQEYFVPRAHLSVFVTQMASILQTHSVNAVNISIRHSPPDPYTCLSWAREEVFSFVLYYWQHVSLADREEVGVWTRKLIDAALSFGGCYYLPYQLHATKEQFSRAYPSALRLFALKEKFDPQMRFRNKLWDKYHLG
ncbi:FAD-binding oxidoreductase [Pseudomonas sp. ADAK18]|nr:FAD-binding oxidoreductase [Pseudomonas sp. ADAK18]